MKKINSFSILFFLSLLFFLSNCDLEKEVDLDLPTYESQLVVECYLEVGKPFTAVISESVSFFASADLPLVSDATVKIIHRGEEIILAESLVFDPTTGKAFNYSSPDICPNHLNEDFKIEVVDLTGRSITATTQILDVVPIDTLETVWRESDSMALVFTRLLDPPSVDNFYRRMFQSGGILGEGRDEQDFTTTDNIAGDDRQIIYGTGFDFEKGDTIISTLFHIDQAYYDFQESIQSAVQNNGNPFAQPGVIKSNIIGGIGIFTGLSYDRKTLIID